MTCQWGYGGENGPSCWHLVEDGVYSISLAGKRQSPINVCTDKVEVTEDLDELKYAYVASNCESVENTGSSWKVNVKCDGSSLTGGPLEDDTYQIAQFHAHWGGENSRGSEHTVDGKMFSAELHLVHFNTKYGSFANAADKPDGLAVLGMLMKVGAEHKEFEKLCEGLKAIPKKGDVMKLTSGLDPSKFLPKSQSYWTYLGSLTTPPLFESVTWILFKQPIEISPKQMKVMREMKFGDANSECMRDNYRPPCPLNGRSVRTPKFL